MRICMGQYTCKSGIVAEFTIDKVESRVLIDVSWGGPRIDIVRGADRLFVKVTPTTDQQETAEDKAELEKVLEEQITKLVGPTEVLRSIDFGEDDEAADVASKHFLKTGEFHHRAEEVKKS